MSLTVPIIDFSKCGLLNPEDDVSDHDWDACGDQVYKAISTYGFAYLTNHGFQWDVIDEMNAVGEKFYSLPFDVKKTFELPDLTLSYDSIGRSRGNQKDIDYYEGFRTSGEAYTDDKIKWPDVPGLKESYTKCADHCKRMLLRVLKTLGHGMKLKDRDFFCKVHSLMNQKGNCSIMKTLKYPPISDDDAATANRIGEHTDKTTLTLLFQDDNGGLQARDAAGNIFDIDPIPGTIILNAGMTFEKWSKGLLNAAIHNVCPPRDPAKRALVRRSVAYFANANDAALMDSLVFEDEVDERDPNEKIWTVIDYVNYIVQQVIASNPKI